MYIFDDDDDSETIGEAMARSRERESRGRRNEDRDEYAVPTFEAPDDVLVRRYAETRRKHPMGELPQAIQLERALMTPFKGRTTATIDSETVPIRRL